MQPSTGKPDIGTCKPPMGPEPDGPGSRIGDYVDLASGALRLQNGGRPDHTYAKSSTWRPQNYLVKPCRHLFSPSSGRRSHSALDVETVDEEFPVPLPPAPGYVVAPADPEHPDEEAVCWTEKISKAGWSPVQVRTLPRALSIVEDVRLRRLASRGRTDERFLVDQALDWGRSRLSHLLAGVAWDGGVARWLHALLVKHLSPGEREDYLLLLGRLEAATPSLDRQVAEALLGEKFSRLPLDPIFFVVPNSLECLRTERFANIVAQLRQMAATHVVEPPPHSRSATVQQGLDHTVAECRARLAEVRGGGGARPLVLIGWGLGAAIASLLAQLEPARAVVCVGYPHSTLDGRADRSNMSVGESTCPVMFVVGAQSHCAAREDVEELRSHMRVPSRLVVVGGCDDRLAMSRADRLVHRVTQSMVDRSVVVEIYNFVGETLTQPAPPPPRAPGPPQRFPVPVAAHPVRYGKRGGRGACSDVPAKQRRPPLQGHRLIMVNPAKYATLVSHHNYAARLQPVPAQVSGAFQRGPPN